MASMTWPLSSKFIGRRDDTVYAFRDAVNITVTIAPPPTNYFRYSGAVLWNSLPPNLRQAKSLNSSINT